ncbi:MAG: hypothetical protein VX546_13550 [Myxococcota bacterium]|nr:hypothetical protein [Myxococcota bacterium]
MTVRRAWRIALAGTALLVFWAAFFAYPPRVTALPHGAWLGFPSPERVLAFATTLAGFLFLNLAVWGAGAWIGRRMPLEPAAGARFLGTLGLGFVALQLAVLALAWLGALAPAGRWGLLFIASAAGVADLVRRERPRLSAGRTLAILAGATALLAGPLLIAFDADPGWDALTYHLPLAERAAFVNGSPVDPWSVFSAFPHAVSMLYLLTQTLDGTALARWLHLEFGVLTAWLAVLLAREASPRAGWLAAAALAACPLFAWELGIAYADLPACFFTLLAVALLRSDSDLARCITAGIFAGAAAACRYPSWIVPFALLALVWLPGAVSGPRLRASAAVLVGTLVSLAPWMARNLAFTGNPVAPAFQGWFAAPGEEFFAPLAVAQNAAFIRSVGPGFGFSDLLALPWRLTVEATPGDYRNFGYRIGPLYLLGVLAALGWGGAAGAALSRRLWVAAGLSALFWFFTAQEPRYLLPTLVLTAVAGAIAADRAVGARHLWLALPVIAVLQAQLPIWTALPQRYGTALGVMPVTEPAAAKVGRRLRADLAPGDRVVILFEPRAWFFRGLDYIPYHLGDGSPLLVAIHAAGRTGIDPLFAGLGATHVVVNTQLDGQVTPSFLPAYSRETFEADLATLNDFLTRRTDLVFSEGPIEVRQIRTPEARP